VRAHQNLKSLSAQPGFGSRGRALPPAQQAADLQLDFQVRPPLRFAVRGTPLCHMAPIIRCALSGPWFFDRTPMTFGITSALLSIIAREIVCSMERKACLVSGCGGGGQPQVDPPLPLGGE